MSAGSSAVPAAERDDWARLRSLTPARIGLGRVGASLPTARHLAFQLAHAQARDAVRAVLDSDRLASELTGLGLEVRQVRSRAGDLATHLRRPDLGRRLDPACHLTSADPRPDLAILVAGGLSATAANRHAVPVLKALLPLLPDRLILAPVMLAEFGRVALGDDVAERLGARLVLVLLGERPGLSAPDSLGAYVTWAPVVGTSDEARNCISNIRPDGMLAADAARSLAHLLAQAHREACTGIALARRHRALLSAGGGAIPSKPDTQA